MLKVAGGGGATTGAITYRGTWNASTNTPTLTSSVGSQGDYYVVSVAGSTNLNGITDWKVGDWAVFNGSVWQKIDNTDAVTSVNGQTGAVVLGAVDVGAASNTTTVSAGGLLSGGGNLASNVTISLVSVPAANVSGLGTMATQNANAVAITGGNIANVSLSNATVDGAAPYLNFANGAGTTLAAGRQWYDGSNGSWNLGMGGGNITQQVGEEIYVYGKATASISGGSILQAVYKTGTNGSSGVVTFAPTIAGITDRGAIIGVATEDIANNGFGRITSFGVVHGVNTNGSTYGETWVDGQDIWYNPVTGGLTKTQPVAPNQKFQIGTVINAGPGGSGSFQVLLQPGSTLGGTDSNVQISASPTNNSFLIYNSSTNVWVDSTNVTITSGSINVQSTNVISTTSSTATFATPSLPLVPAGYLQIDLNGTVVKVPYYAV